MFAVHTYNNAWRYGLLGLPLAFVSLPLYVTLPRHYAEHYAVPLGVLGLLLLITRLFDALLDPRIGRWVDTLFEQDPYRAWLAAALGSALLTLGFSALWNPPAQTAGTDAPLLWWLGGALLLTYLAYSVVSMVHQAWAARWGGTPEQRARLLAWREGAAIVGVLLASILPIYLGLQVTTLALVVTLLLGLWTLHQTLPAQLQALRDKQLANRVLYAGVDGNSQNHKDASPWRTPAFAALLVVFLLNGTASAMPATLLPFFVRDTLQAATWESLFLGSYFLAAALGLPLWVRLIRRIGLAYSWLLGMALSVLAFAAVPWLGAGDVLAFEFICILTGLALGADLAVPSALLTGVIHQAGLGQQSEGRFFGWWTAATKLNLALAAGLVLPLLALLGFQTGQHTASNQFALTMTYGLLPCIFKVLAAAALLWAMQRHPVLKGRI